MARMTHRCLLLCLLSCYLALAELAISTPAKTLFFPEAPTDEWISVGWPERKAQIYFTLVPKARNLGKLRELSRSISDPLSPSWRAFLTRSDALSLIAEPEHRLAFAEWLNENAPEAMVVSHSVLGVRVRCSVSVATKLFDTELQTFQGRGELLIVRAVRPLRVPRHVAERLSYVEGLLDFPASFSRPMYQLDWSSLWSELYNTTVSLDAQGSVSIVQFGHGCLNCLPNEWLRNLLFDEDANATLPDIIYSTFPLVRLPQPASPGLSSLTVRSALADLELLIELYGLMGGTFIAGVGGLGEWPASSDFVTAVAATQILHGNCTPATFRYPDGSQSCEASVFGAPRSSAYLTTPSWYQLSIQGASRGYPDVAVLGFETSSARGSAALLFSALAAQLVELAKLWPPGSGGLGLITPLLYQMARDDAGLFRDIDGAGWSAASGLGAPNIGRMREYLSELLAARLPICDSMRQGPCLCRSNFATPRLCRDACGNCPVHLQCYEPLHFGCGCTRRNASDCVRVGGHVCALRACTGESCCPASGCLATARFRPRLTRIFDTLAVLLLIFTVLLGLVVMTHRPSGYARHIRL